MSEMVERVARASFDFWKSTQPGKEDLKFEDLNNTDDEMEFALAHARAIIEAMREPTEEMFCAGDERIIEALNDISGIARDPTPAKASWQAMIEAALEES